MLVYKPGSFVNIGPMAAIIIAVMVKQDHVTYQIVVWDGMTRNEYWIEAFEIVESQDDLKCEVGFHEI